MIKQQGAIPSWVLIGSLILLVLGVAFNFLVLPIFTKPVHPTSKPQVLAPPTPVPSSEVAIKDTYFYQLDITQKPDAPTPSGPLGLYLAKVLGLPKAYQQNFNLGLGILMYDTRNTDPSKDRFNAKYFLVVQNAKSYGVDENFELDPTKVYEDSSISIKVSIPDPSLLPFMSVNNNYCQTDNDCTYIYKYCKSGPSNYYAWVSDQGGCRVANPPSNIQVKCQANQCVGM